MPVTRYLPRLIAAVAAGALAASAAVSGPATSGRAAGASADAAERAQERIALRRLHPTPACPLPRVSHDERLIAVGAYESSSLSSSWVGSPDDTTHVIDVNIEPGEQPLYLVLTSYEAMVWRFTGATNRVRHVVVTSFRTARRHGDAAGRPRRTYRYGERTPAEAWRVVSASGVVGLPRQKVVIAPSHCPRHFYGIGEAERAMATAREALERSPDEVFAAPEIGSVSLPSRGLGPVERASTTAPAGFDQATWEEALGFWPGGIAWIRPSSIVAAAPVASYEVLPSEMGIAQLIGAGAIEPLGRDEFRLMRAIPRLPSGMAGGHSVTLILAEGVPRPPGDPAHSCVLNEAQEAQFRANRRCPPAN